MTELAVNYGKVLFDLGIEPQVVDSTVSILQETPILYRALQNPTIQIEEKYHTIDTIFDNTICKFLKVLCRNQQTELLFDIVKIYKTLLLESKNCIEASFTSAVAATEEQLQAIKTFLCKQYQKQNAVINMNVDSAIIGGCILRVNNTVYDKSIATALKNLNKALKKR